MGKKFVVVLATVAVLGTGSWLLYDSEGVPAKYKAEVLAQPTKTGEFKHMEWDVWGFAGLETEVYLVFDPSDSLRTAAEKHLPGKYDGIPCKVYRVERLEDHWYKVQFYTNTAWNYCRY